jgi:hypothetical protein
MATPEGAEEVRGGAQRGGAGIALLRRGAPTCPAFSQALDYEGHEEVGAPQQDAADAMAADEQAQEAEQPEEAMQEAGQEAEPAGQPQEAEQPHEPEHPHEGGAEQPREGEEQPQGGGDKAAQSAPP